MLLTIQSAWAGEPFRFGVLAVRPKAQALEQWRPLAEHLERSIGRRVELVACDFNEMNHAVEAKRLDVVVTNPGHYVLLRHRYGLSAPIATRLTQEEGHQLTTFGGVIFTRADSQNISTLADLKGKRIATVGTESMGSHLMQAFELKKAGLETPEPRDLVITEMPHDRVVEAVLSGKAEAGFVRCGLIESMLREGKLDPRQLRIIHRQYPEGYPFITSTRLYPEWPVAVLPQVDIQLASLVTVTLLSLPPESPAARAAGIAGFRIPLDYGRMEDLLKELRYPPFDARPDFTIADAWQRYSGWMTAIGVLLLALAGLGARFLTQNRRLAESEEKLRTVTDFSLDWEYWEGPHEDIIYMSPSAETLTGYPVSAFMDDPRLILDLVHPEDRPRLEKHLASERDHEREELDFRIVRKDGATRWISHVCHLVRDTKGHGKGRRVSNRDITDRKEAEEELRLLYRSLRAKSACDQAVVQAKSENELLSETCRIVVEMGGYRLAWVGFAEQDEARTVKPVAQAGFEEGYMDTLRISWGDSRGKAPTGNAIHFGKPYMIREILTDPDYAPWRAQAEKRGYASSLALPLKSGEQVFGALNIYSERPNAFNDNELRLLVDLADTLSFGILHLRNQEARIRAQDDRATLEEQIHHLQRMESIGRLAGGVAHDMNNVLAAVMAAASIIQERGGEHTRRASLILEAGQRGRDLVKGLMEFARKGVQDAELLDLNLLVSKEAELFESTTMHRIRIEQDLAPDLPLVVGSASAMSNSLMNLCINAVDAMPQGGTLRFRTSCQGKKDILLEVEDTGSGMPPEVLARAMEPFFTTKPLGKGTGLGLSVVFGTIQAHGGSIGIQSWPGKGTLIQIRLPAAPRESAKPAGTSSNPPQGPSSDLRILLVDDDPLVRESTQALLETFGCTITSASGGLEAMGWLERGLDCDVVILDLNMPDFSGLETMQGIRRINPTLPVVVASGYADETVRKELEGFPLVAVLAKPYTPGELQEVIRALLPK